MEVLAKGPKTKAPRFEGVIALPSLYLRFTHPALPPMDAVGLASTICLLLGGHSDGFSRANTRVYARKPSRPRKRPISEL